jgi:tetratricopeptide (TPR) repeat protein
MFGMLSRWARLTAGFVLSALLVGCLTPGRTGAPGTPTGYQLSEGDALFAQALAHYTQGLVAENEPGWGPVETIRQFRLAIGKDPSRYPLYARLAAIYLQRQQVTEAVDVLEEATRANPDHVQAWEDLALLYEATGRPDDALANYRRSLRIDPLRPNPYWRTAKIHFMQDRDRKAMDLLRKGFARCTNDTPIVLFCYNVGLEFIARGNLDRAVPCFELLAEQDTPRRYHFYLMLGELYEGVENVSRAEYYYQRATASDATQPDAVLKLASVALDQGDPARAIRILQESLSHTPRSPRVLIALATIFNWQKDYEKAISYFQQVDNLSTNDPAIEAKLTADFYLHYGSAYERWGKITEAGTVFQRGLQRYPKAHEILNYAAYMWAEAGINLDQALLFINRALRIEPENGAYLDTLGWIYYKQQMFHDALDQIRKAAALVKDDATIADHLGDILLALKKTHEAVEHWKRSYQLDPDNEKVAEKLRTRGVDLQAIRAQPEPLPADGAPASVQ